MKKLMFCVVICATVFTACSKPADKGYQEYFEEEEPVDFSDLLTLHCEAEEAGKAGQDFDLTEKLLGNQRDENDRILLVNDTSFAVYLPQYKNNAHPFLAQAEEFYNACQFAVNIWSNFEICFRLSSGITDLNEEDICDSIKSISAACIRNPEMRQAAQVFQDSILLAIQSSEEDGMSYDIFQAFSRKIESHVYRFYTNHEAFIDSLRTMTQELTSVTKDDFLEYQKTDEEKRTEFMLERLNGCSSFDEQCSLLLNWANCPESMSEDEWIVAVAGRLLSAGKYNPCLDRIWMIWRCLFQCQYFGLSRDSSIPNNLYNEKRKDCYLVCLKRLETHPEDVFAMNSAAFLGGTVNLNRFGMSEFGNEAIAEQSYFLPERFSTDEADGDEDAAAY